jgi:hypothetical protein
VPQPAQAALVLVQSQTDCAPTLQVLGATQLGCWPAQHTWPGPPHGAQTRDRAQVSDGSAHVPFVQHGRPAKPQVALPLLPALPVLPPLPVLPALPALPALPVLPALPPLPTAPAPAEPMIVPGPPSP